MPAATARRPATGEPASAPPASDPAIPL